MIDHVEVVVVDGECTLTSADHRTRRGGQPYRSVPDAGKAAAESVDRDQARGVRHLGCRRCEAGQPDRRIRHGTIAVEDEGDCSATPPSTLSDTVRFWADDLVSLVTPAHMTVTSAPGATGKGEAIVTERLPVPVNFRSRTGNVFVLLSQTSNWQRKADEASMIPMGAERVTVVDPVSPSVVVKFT